MTRPKPGWWKLRKWVASRANDLCEANTPGCPDYPHRGEQAHHIQRRSQGGADDIGNLLWVCGPGHRYIHDHPAESFDRGWLRHWWEGTG